MAIDQDFAVWLAAEPTVSALAGDRVYAEIAPSNPVFPFVVLQRITTERVRSLAGPSGRAAVIFQVDCWAKTAAARDALADALRRTVDGRTRVLMGTTRVGAVAVQADQGFYDEQTREFRRSLDVMIAHEES